MAIFPVVPGARLANSLCCPLSEGTLNFGSHGWFTVFHYIKNIELELILLLSPD